MLVFTSDEVREPSVLSQMCQTQTGKQPLIRGRSRLPGCDLRHVIMILSCQQGRGWLPGFKSMEQVVWVREKNVFLG